MPQQFLLYFTFIILLAINACSPSIPNSNDWEKLHLKGQVQQLEEWTYPSYTALQHQQHSFHQKSWFSNIGHLTKTVFYEKENRLIWSYYTYKEDSVWIRRALQEDDGEEQNQNYWLYQLNQYGQQKTLTSLQLDTSIFYTVTIDYNQQHLPSQLTYSQQLQPALVPCQVKRTYNEQGRVLKEEVSVYDKTSQQCYPQPTISTYKYNEQGEIEREKITYYNGKEESYSYQYQYDSLGNWTNRLHYRGDEVIEVSKREFIYFK